MSFEDFCSRHSVRSHMRPTLVFDLGSQQRNHPVENAQLKADKGDLPVERNEHGMTPVVERRPGAQFRANLLPEKSPQLFTQPVYRETFSGREGKLHDRLGGELPTLSAVLDLGSWERKRATSATGGFPTVRSRWESTCV